VQLGWDREEEEGPSAAEGMTGNMVVMLATWASSSNFVFSFSFFSFYRPNFIFRPKCLKSAGKSDIGRYFEWYVSRGDSVPTD
jgi:hypothetical protein